MLKVIYSYTYLAAPWAPAAPLTDRDQLGLGYRKVNTLFVSVRLFWLFASALTYVTFWLNNHCT